MQQRVLTEDSKLTPEAKNWLYIIIAVVIVLILIRNRHKIANLFEAKAPDRSAEDQGEQPIPDSRKQFIHGLANNLYNDIYETPWLSHNHLLYSQALGLMDNELKYLATYYRQNLSSGSTLNDDIGGEWYSLDFPTTSDAPYKLRTELSRVGEN